MENDSEKTSMLNVYTGVMVLKKLGMFNLEKLITDLDLIYKEAEKQNQKKIIRTLENEFKNLNDVINFKNKEIKTKIPYQRTQEEIDVISYIYLLNIYNNILKYQKYNYSIDVTQLNKNIKIFEKENINLKSLLKEIKTKINTLI